ncbi:hypothetical protein DDT48_20850 [Mycobacteroides abscessus]|uniref:hypothetical protein n=1 Tax=Mycobacteroides abscessus TaxID=36809 RepID=UPI0009A8B9A6|nr:hypothetical protein [Mycobacteroides abscessus]AWG51597.1 hypothetical protein DDT48_20850 [Mycobacteroides abscessus]MDO3096763.1 hypothetical protein [Mycobacteroides abscessus subsp. abscessus]RIU09651.1 hypothetical protein D2E94_11120 [Mycobacteroides abscessus]SLF58024.1 Uncharacterised protein [Mycobacteroides abscessus subsp. abscessus]
MLDGQPLGEYPPIPPWALIGDAVDRAMEVLFETIGIVSGIPVMGSRLQLGVNDSYPWYVNGPDR